MALSEKVSAGRLEDLRSGKLDLALVRPPIDESEFDSRLVFAEPLALVIPQGHRLDAEGPVPMTALAGEHLLVFAPGPARYFADLLTRVLAGVHYTSTHQLTQVPTMLALVMAGRGLAIVPASTGQPRPHGRPASGPVARTTQAVALPSHPVSISPGGSPQAAAAACRIRAAAAAPGSSTPRATSPT